jgi:hypothetical protein
MSATALIDRLERVKSTGPGRWLALCPAHQDKNPSLSIRETEDGTVLVKCFAGCGVADVVAAVGLELRDLFPSDNGTFRKALKPRERWIPRDVLHAVAAEALVVIMAAQQLKTGAPLQPEDLERLETAESRLRAAAGEVGCYG